MALRRIRRRWCWSLLPIALIASLATPLSEALVIAAAHHPRSIPLAMVTGLLVGLLMATLSITVTVMASAQMTSAVRMLLLMTFFQLTVVVLTLLPVPNKIVTFYLPEVMFVVLGAMIARLLSDSFRHDHAVPYSLTGPTSREIGVSSFSVEVQCLLLAAALLGMFALSANQEFPRDPAVSAAVAGCGFALGFSATWSLLAEFACCRRQWRLLATATFALSATLVGYLLTTLGHPNAGLSTRARVIVVVAASVAALLGQRLLLRYLRWSGWRWQPDRQFVIARRDGQLHLAATDRFIGLLQRRAVTSIAGVLMLTVGFLLTVSLGHKLSEGQKLLLWWNDSDLPVWDMLFICTTVGFSLASLTVIGIMADHHCRTLLWQTLLMAGCYVVVLLSLEITNDSVLEFQLEAIFVASALAFPIVLGTRMLLALVNRFSSLRIGVMSQPKRQLQIRSIMGLTLLVGVQIILLQGVFADLLAVEVIAFVAVIAVAVWFHAISLIWLRMSLGRRRWFHLFWIATLALVPSGAAFFAAFQFTTIQWGLMLTASAMALATYFATLWLLASWLRSRGWTIQPPHAIATPA